MIRHDLAIQACMTLLNRLDSPRVRMQYQIREDSVIVAIAAMIASVISALSF